MEEIYVDIKQTIWTRFYFKKGTNIDKLISAIKEDINEVANDNLGFISSEDLLDTYTDVSLEENDGHSTIIIMDGIDELWKNGK